ncbi:MAG: hypothetical protein JNK37_03965 [Verrucomicrobiales bacterium]|nr:hypothetical protein [Verrucomicrobiales bacterium]
MKMPPPRDDLHYKFHLGCLLESLKADFDGPIYRNEDDLEAVRNSDSDVVAVVSPGRPMVFYVSREKFLRGEVGLNAGDLFMESMSAGVPFTSEELDDREADYPFAESTAVGDPTSPVE